MASITSWTRLEPFTRLDDVDAGLQAEIADPLWLLARQWQTGEFDGEDSGTPVQVRARMERAPLARFHAGPLPDGPSVAGRPYQSRLPLEALVEREAVQLATDPRRDLRLAAEAGLYFLRLLEQAGVSPEVRAAFAHEPAHALKAPAGDPAGGQDRAGQRYLALMAGRVPDGFRLYQALARSLRPAQGSPRLPRKPAVPAAERPRAIQAGQAFLRWFEERYTTPPAAGTPPSGAPAWISERMEYSFAVSAASGAGEVALAAPEYPGGTLDWYSVDLRPGLALGVRPTDPRPQAVTRTVMPAPVRYPGMASDRWWQFEDAAVNFSRIEGDPDELLRLLLVAFALVYSNDWYVVPIDATPGAVYRVDSLVVTDAFGERTLVPHYGDVDPAAHDWRMFAPAPARASLTTTAADRGNVLFVPPVLAGSLHGDPLEEVLFLRDELTNLVWAVERLAPSLAGGSLDRSQLYYETRGDGAPPPPEAPAGDELRYRLATAVPDHWIPFQPVRIDPALPDIRLRRAAALTRESGEPAFSRPLGRILEPERTDLSLFEEEVPRSGLRLVRQWQYARWVDGSTFLWLARRKGVGRGEGSSGLAFDAVEEG